MPSICLICSIFVLLTLTCLDFYLTHQKQEKRASDPTRVERRFGASEPDESGIVSFSADKIEEYKKFQDLLEEKQRKSDVPSDEGGVAIVDPGREELHQANRCTSDECYSAPIDDCRGLLDNGYCFWAVVSKTDNMTHYQAIDACQSDGKSDLSVIDSDEQFWRVVAYLELLLPNADFREVFAWTKMGAIHWVDNKTHKMAKKRQENLRNGSQWIIYVGKYHQFVSLIDYRTLLNAALCEYPLDE